MPSTSRSLIRILLLVLILAGIAPFALPLKDGKPLLRFSDLKLPEFKAPQWSKTLQHKLQHPEQPAPRTVYRWQGEDGSVQFGEEPPADGRPYEALTVDPNVNLMAGERASSEDGQKEPAVSFDLGKVGATLDQARGLDDAVKARTARQEELLERP